MPVFSISQEKIDRFFDTIAEEMVYLKIIFTRYIEQGRLDVFLRERAREILDRVERCNTFRYLIVTSLYTEIASVEFPRDIVSLIEEMFVLLDTMVGTLRKLIDEIAERIRGDLVEEFQSLLAISLEMANTVISAIKEFLVDSVFVENYINRINILESEAERIEVNYTRKILDSDLSTEQKVQARSIIQYLLSLVGETKNVRKKLSICLLQRSL
jgi:hypothetical protein